MTRDKSIDLLRCIALLGILLAHISPPPFLLHLRGFDVPMMVFLSGVVFSRRHGLFGGFKDLGRYWLHRIKRIILPVWLFLFLYFGVMSVLTGALPQWSRLLPVFSLCTRWYVWIFRVFIIVAFAAPLLSVLTNRFRVEHLYIGGVGFLLLFQVIERFYFPGLLYYAEEAIPYMVVFLFGMLVDKAKKQWVVWTALAWGIAFFFMALWKFHITGHYVAINTCKYPPQLYYLAYGLGCIGFLWLIKDRLIICMHRIPLLERFVLFVGSHSMWIYLWHILFLEFTGAFCTHSAGILHYLHLPLWFAKLLFILICSCALTFLQSLLVEKLKNANLHSRFFNWLYPILEG